MSISNNLSIIAILISTGSLLVAIRSARFDRAAKSSELRAAVLAKITEASARIAHVSELRADIRAHAEGAKDFEWFKRASNIDSDRLRQEIEQVFSELAAIPANKGISLHTKLFHTACKLNELAIGYERTIQQLFDAQTGSG